MTKVTPAYPPLAKQARLQGTVRFNALIGKDGTVQAVHVGFISSMEDELKEQIGKLVEGKALVEEKKP